MLSTQGHLHTDKCTEGCTADLSIPKKTVSNDTIVSYVKDKNACQHNIIALLKNKQTDENALKEFFDRFDPPPPPCDSETKTTQFELEKDFLTKIEATKSLSALAKLIVDAKIDCQAELFTINEIKDNKKKLWDVIKNRAKNTIKDKDKKILDDLENTQKKLEGFQKKLNDGAIKHSGIKDILTTDILPTTDTSGKINLTEGLPDGDDKNELEKKINEYKDNPSPKKDDGLFMEIIAWFANMINKLLGRVDTLETEMADQKKATNENKTKLEAQQQKLDALAIKITPSTATNNQKGESKNSIQPNSNVMTIHNKNCNIFTKKVEDDNLTDKYTKNKAQYFVGGLATKIQKARNSIQPKYNNHPNFNKKSSCKI